MRVHKQVFHKQVFKQTGFYTSLNRLLTLPRACLKKEDILKRSECFHVRPPPDSCSIRQCNELCKLVLGINGPFILYANKFCLSCQNITFLRAPWYRFWLISYSRKAVLLLDLEPKTARRSTFKRCTSTFNSTIRGATANDATAIILLRWYLLVQCAAKHMSTCLDLSRPWSVVVSTYISHLHPHMTLHKDDHKKQLCCNRYLVHEVFEKSEKETLSKLRFPVYSSYHNVHFQIFI